MQTNPFTVQRSSRRFSDAAASVLQKQYLTTSHRVFRSPKTPRRLLARRSAEASPVNSLPKLGLGAIVRRSEDDKPEHRRTQSYRKLSLFRQPSCIFDTPLHSVNSRTKREYSYSRRKQAGKKEVLSPWDFSNSIKSHFETSRICPNTTIDFYRLLRPIGKGAHGKVILGTHRLCGLPVAIKAVAKERLRSEIVRKQVFQEVMVLKLIQHPRIVKVLEVFEAEKHMLIVFEYMAGGDLRNYLRAKTRLAEPEARHLFRQIVEGVAAVHSRKVIHRDLKLENILLDAEHTNVKICDFGICKAFGKGQLLNDQSGTPAYIAPEVLAEQGAVGYASDLWSLGVMLYALLTGKFPFTAENSEDLNKQILTGSYPPPLNVSTNASNLIASLLALLPSHRIRVDEVLSHHWLLEGTSELLTLSSFGDERYEMQTSAHDSVAASMNSLGWPSDLLKESLRNSELNYGTACYSLMKSASQGKYI